MENFKDPNRIINFETNSKRLARIEDELSLIYINSRENLSFEKKLESYSQANSFNEEGSRIIDNLQAEISSLTFNDLNPKENAPVISINKINEYIDLLSNNINFDEAMHIAKEFYAISLGIPTCSEIIDDINEEVIYEEQEVKQGQ